MVQASVMPDMFGPAESEANMAVAMCCICWMELTDEIMMCPKDGKTLLCRGCISRLDNDRCPVCKQEVLQEEYARNRPLEEMRHKQCEKTNQGHCHEHTMDHVYYCEQC